MGLCGASQEVDERIGGMPMLDAQQMQAASNMLVRLWREGRRLPALPESLRPRSRAEGYAIQALIEARSAEPLAGWKIAATSEQGQRHINVEGPMAGRLLAERVHESGAALPLGDTLMRVAEPELAFRLGRPLAPRPEPYETDEVLAAVESLHPAIELPDSRYDDFTVVGAAQLIADNACAHEFVLGPACDADWRALDLAAHPVVARVGDGPAVEGSGAAALGDPRSALAWLVNELSGLGLTLEPGQVVTTGTCMTPLAVEPGDAVAVEMGVVGTVTLRIAP